MSHFLPPDRPSLYPRQYYSLSSSFGTPNRELYESCLFTKKKSLWQKLEITSSYIRYINFSFKIRGGYPSICLALLKGCLFLISRVFQHDSHITQTPSWQQLPPSITQSLEHINSSEYHNLPSSHISFQNNTTIMPSQHHSY